MDTAVVVVVIINIVAIHCVCKIELPILCGIKRISKLFVSLILIVTVIITTVITTTIVMRDVSLILYRLMDVWTSCRVALAPNRFVNSALNRFVNLFMSFIVYFSPNTHIVSHRSLNDW